MEETYVAVDKKQLENYKQPEQDNVEQLKAILENLAELQATFLSKSHVKNNQTLPLTEYIKTVASLENIKTLDQNQFSKTAEKIQTNLDKVLLQKDLLVPSIWTLSNKVYVNSDLKVLLPQVSSQDNLVPPVLDALLYIFSLSTENFRQNYFKALVQNYFDFLKQHLANLSSNIQDTITGVYKDLQVRILLPVVKVMLVSEYNKSKQNTPPLLNNLTNYFQYPLIHQEEVYEVLYKKLNSSDFHLISYKMVPLSEKNGHLGEYYYLKVILKVHGEEKTMDFFCKFLLGTTDFLQEIVETKGIGKKEDFFYGTLYPLYEKYGLGKLLDFAPKCYLHGVSGYMVLENLTGQGFSAPKVNTILNLDGLKAILDKLAKYHACTFILEEKLSDESGKQIRLYDIYENYLAEMIAIYQGTMTNLIDKNLKAVEHILNKFPDLVEQLNMSPSDLQESLKDFIYSILFLAKRSESVRSVVNHGDLYAGNILIKYGTGKSVLEGMLIDFQLIRYIPPAYEVMFFIYVSSSQETRSKHLKHLLDWYYENLTRHLKEFDLDPHKIYSRQDFETDMHEMKPIAVSMAFAYGQLTHIDSDLREEVMFDQEKYDYHIVNHREEFVDLCWENEHYKNTMRGLMEDTVDMLKNGFRWDRSKLCLNI